MTFGGVFDLSVWGYIVVALVLTHVTIACVTIFLHRRQAHRALDCIRSRATSSASGCGSRPGMVTKEWVADPPQAPRQVRDRRRSAQPADARHQRRAVLAAPSSIARSRRTRRRWTSTATARRTTGSSATSTRATRWQGVGAACCVDQPRAVRRRSALAIWAVQMVWIPFWAAGIINGIGHYWGYRNFDGADASTQHRAVGHPDRRRRAAQQPPRVRHSAKLSATVVRVRHRLDVHPLLESFGLARRPARRAANRVRAGQDRDRPRHAARGDRQPLRRAQALRSARDRARAACGCRRGEPGFPPTQIARIRRLMIREDVASLRHDPPHAPVARGCARAQPEAADRLPVHAAAEVAVESGRAQRHATGSSGCRPGAPKPRRAESARLRDFARQLQATRSNRAPPTPPNREPTLPTRARA